GINPDFSGLSLSTRQIAYALRTRAPVSLEQAPNTPRLACVRPAASVHPEPGSNSSSYNLYFNPLINSKSYLASSFCCQSNLYMYVCILYNLYKAKTS